jgi:tetratricopeptide (TPR) repeat protein
MFLHIAVFSQNKDLESKPTKDSFSTQIKEEVLLRKTKDYISRKEYDKAALFLSKYYNNFSESLYVNWLYAHVLSMNDDKKKAIRKFKKAISIVPSNKNLQLDYARLLYEMGKIDKVESILSNFMDDDSKNVEFLLMQANISFWKGNLKNSQRKIDRIQEIYPETKITKSLSEQIKELTALYIKTNLEYQSDSQPLNYFARHVILGQYNSRFLNLKLEISNYNFSPEKEQALIVNLTNQFYFDQLKLTTNINGGIYKNYSGKTDWLGGINFTHKLTQNLSLNLGYSKESLLGTIASTTFNLTHQNVFGSFDYNNKFIVFHAGYNEQFFQDDNTIKSIASWLVSQPIKIQKFNFQFGYGYSFSDSENILFFYNNEGIGTYDLYFTPKEQEIHSGLFITSYKPIKKLTIEAKINYGFIATVRNPYPVQVAPNNTVIGGFYDEEFTYAELNGSVNYSFSNSFAINANYLYQETFFYKRDNINLGFNFTF